MSKHPNCDRLLAAFVEYNYETDQKATQKAIEYYWSTYEDCPNELEQIEDFLSKTTDYDIQILLGEDEKVDKIEEIESNFTAITGNTALTDFIDYLSFVNFRPILMTK